MDGRARVAWNLRRLRTAQGISQINLAVDAGVNRTYVSSIETQEYNPTVGILDRLAKALNVDVAAFFAKVDPAASPVLPLRPGRRAGPKSRGSAVTRRKSEP